MPQGLPAGPPTAYRPGPAAAQHNGDWPRARADPLEQLTEREREALALVAEEL